MTQTYEEDIAIVGMAGIYPQADDIDIFWSNILNKVDAVTDSPDAWLGDGDIYDPDTAELSKIYTRKGGFLGDLSRFDAKSFGTMPLSVTGAQPDQFLALKLSHDALVDAGLTPGEFDGSRTGVILGHAVHAHRANTNGVHQVWLLSQTRNLLKTLFPDVASDRIEAAMDLMQNQLPKIAPDAVPGLVPNIMTGRVANRLDLMGPNYIIDAACSSSIITVDLAMNELRAGNADIMLAGGVNTTTSPLVYAVFCSVGALSRTGQIRPFDTGANGTVLGEGAGVVVLKRLSDAIKADDRIYAVIKGCGQSSDGKSSGLMAPRYEGEVLAIERAYQNSGIDPATIGLVEAHGTGIPLGERTEVDALRHVFGERQGEIPTVPIGSVKSMIGHCIPASGSAAIIKMALSLKNQIVPPTLVDEVNEESGLPTTPFYVANEARPWIHSADHPRRAAINAFGFGGINAHIVLEEAPVGQEPDPTAAFVSPVPTVKAEQVFVFAGPDKEAVLATLDAFEVPEAEGFDAAAAASWAAAEGPARLAIVAADPADLTKKIGAARKALSKPEATSVQTRNGIYFEAAPIDGKIAFLFPGEMAQYTDMMEEAALAMPAIRDWFGFIASLTEGRRPTRLQDVIYPPTSLIGDDQRKALEGLMHQVDYGSEMVFAADQAIFATLTALGIKPHAMLGHSTGENAALVASGLLQLDRAAVGRMIARMNEIFDDISRRDIVPKGVLLTVAALDRPVLEEIMGGFPEVHFTMDNCPNQAILFGQKAEIDALQEAVLAKGAVCTRLPISWGYHTDYVAPMADAFGSLFEGVEMGQSETVLYSCATAKPFPTDRDAFHATAVSQYVNKVRFTDAIEQLYEDGHRIFIECGPNANLTAFVRDILGDKPHLAEAADNKRRGFLSQLRHVLARLYTAGLSLNAGALLNPTDSSDALRRREVRDAYRRAPALPSELPVVDFRGELGDQVRELLLGGQPAPAPAPAIDEAAANGTAVHAAPANGVAVNGTANGTHVNGTANGTPSPAIQTGGRPALAPGQPIVLPQGPDDPRRIHVLDLAHYFPLPFPYRAYLMQGAPSFEGVTPYLGAAEMAEAAAAAAPDAHAGRWQEWSLSRLAVKRAAADIIAAEAGTRPPENRMEVLKDANGAPYLSTDLGTAPYISISHVQAAAVGTASGGGWRLGVDYEIPARIRDPEGFLDMILSAEEKAALAPSADAETVVALWSVKEAAAKSLGIGLQGRPKEFAITDLDPDQGTALVRHGPYQLAAHMRRVGDGICSVAYLAAS